MVDKRKPKVGVITFHRAINYGAILQAYALKTTINNMGADCSILDYRFENIENHHKSMRILDCKNLKDIIRYLFISKRYNKKNYSFRRFAERYLSLSRIYYNKEQIQNDEALYDKFITGSDQVWNYKINNMDSVYFLAQIGNRTKKTSYAASFGVREIPSKYKNQYINWLNDFNDILVREKQGCDIVKELLNREAKVVLDPTLLLSKNQWEEISLSKINRNISEKYILIYAFGGSKYIFDFARKISKEKGCKIVWISNSYKPVFGIKNINSASPEEFIRLFLNAQYILTNSFHGTVFSINFNKQFYTELLPKSKGTNSRMQDVLEMFNLENRIITNNSYSNTNEQIDYGKVNNILEGKRVESLEFLKATIFN